MFPTLKVVEAVNFLDKLLQYDHYDRLTAREAMRGCHTCRTYDFGALHCWVGVVQPSNCNVEDVLLDCRDTYCNACLWNGTKALKLFDALDLNHDGSISWEEFSSFLQENSEYLVVIMAAHPPSMRLPAEIGDFGS